MAILVQLSRDVTGSILLWREKITHAEVELIISWVIAPLIQTAQTHEATPEHPHLTSYCNI